MKETTIITTVEITEVIKDAPECFTLDKEAEQALKQMGE